MMESIGNFIFERKIKKDYFKFREKDAFFHKIEYYRNTLRFINWIPPFIISITDLKPFQFQKLTYRYTQSSQISVPWLQIGKFVCVGERGLIRSSTLTPNQTEWLIGHKYFWRQGASLHKHKIEPKQVYHPIRMPSRTYLSITSIQMDNFPKNIRKQQRVAIAFCSGWAFPPKVGEWNAWRELKGMKLII